MHGLHPLGRALPAAFRLALLAALAVVNGCASDDGDGEPGPSVDPTPAVYNGAPVGIWKCHKNLQPRSIVVRRGPFGNNTCSIIARELPGSSDYYCVEDGCPSCEYLQKHWQCPSL